MRTVGKHEHSPPQLQLLLLFPKTNERWSSLVQRRNHLEKHSAGFKPISYEHGNMLEGLWREKNNLFCRLWHRSKIGLVEPLRIAIAVMGVHPFSCDGLLLADGTCGSVSCGKSLCGEWKTNIHFIRSCDSLYCSNIKGVIFLLFHCSSKHNLLRYRVSLYGTNHPIWPNCWKSDKKWTNIYNTDVVLMWKIKVLLAFTRQILIFFLKFFESFSII